MKKSFSKLISIFLIVVLLVAIVPPTWSFADSAKNTLVLRLNTSNALFDGKKIDADPTNNTIYPFTLFSKTMIPVRCMETFSDVKVKYNEATMNTTVTKGNTQLFLELNSYKMEKTVDGIVTYVDLPTPSTMVEGKTYIPVREVAEELGFSVKYDPGSYVIVVTNFTPSSSELSSAIKDGTSKLPTFVKGISSITAIDPERTLDVGKTAKLTADDINFKPKSVGCQRLLYSSSNPDVASVTTKGRVTVHQKYSFKIFVTSHNGKVTEFIFNPSYDEAPSDAINVMLMTQGDMDENTASKVTKAVNSRIKALGHNFEVEFSWAGSSWSFEELDSALLSGKNVPDIFPAHSWSGSVPYDYGAEKGYYLRLDEPNNNLLKKYGPDLYGKASDSVKAVAAIPGNQGFGIYNYMIEKDCVTDVGYLVNTTLLNELGFKLSDFSADISTWGNILAAFKAKYPTEYPLNIEPITLDRAVNHIAFVADNDNPLAIVFDNNNIAGTNVEVTNRYNSNSYKNMINTMNGYFKKGYVDPDQGTIGEAAVTSFATRRDSGNYLISTCVYAPGFEDTMSTAATWAQGKNIKIDYVSAYSSPIGFTETANGSGFAVYSGTKNAAAAVTFLNMMASDKVIGNLLSEGIEGSEGEAGTSFYVEDGTAWRQNERAGWNIWRYGVVGCKSASTPLGNVDPSGDEWVNMAAFNDAAVALPSTGCVFYFDSVMDEYNACIDVCRKYINPLGSGILDPSEHSKFMSELKAAGVDKVIAEANRQYDAFVAAK